MYPNTYECNNKNIHSALGEAYDVFTIQTSHELLSPYVGKLRSNNHAVYQHQSIPVSNYDVFVLQKIII